MPTESTHAPDEAQPPTPTLSMALIAVAHGKPTILYSWLNDPVEQHVNDAGEEQALDEALPTPTDGIWVCELDLVDDGPSDWSPDLRECRLDATSTRAATPEEWQRFVADDYVWDGEIPPCDCDDGTVWLTEQGIIDEIKAEEGTGKPITFTFGFNGRSRTWRACTKCPAGAEKAGRS